MIKDQIIRMFALMSLLIASLTMLGQETQFCTYGYLAPNQITYLMDLNGGIAKDPDMIGVCAMVALFFFLPLVLSYHRGWYFFFFIVLFIIQAILLLMIESASVIKLIFDSVKYCQNYWVLTWSIGQILFWLLSIIFIFKPVKE